MPKHRALIVGGGRIGAGYNWAATPFVYTHADAYLALKDRVELVGFVEPDPGRLECAGFKYGVDTFRALPAALEALKPDLVSICTQPTERCVILGQLNNAESVKGIWCEKPLNIPQAQYGTLKPMNVNYWRRFDSPHQRVAEKIKSGRWGKVLGMTVAAKRNEATVCHFTHLALWWGVPASNFHYCDVTTPGYVEASYHLYCEKAVVSWQEGGMLMFGYEGAMPSRWFPGHNIQRGEATDQRLTKPAFMETALAELLDYIEGHGKLSSPPEQAIKAEEWADAILNPPRYTL